jgi:hypothetical protein
MKSTQVNKAARCPACLKSNDGATSMREDATPKPDDLSVCIYCGQVNVFQTDLTLRAMRKPEFEALPGELRRDIAIARRAVTAFNQRRPKPLPP